jgi:hypothetical protein
LADLTCTATSVCNQPKEAEMTEHHGHGGHGDHGGNGEKVGDGTEGVHGMLLFGADTLYLSHLPMFMRPHNYQVILEVVVDDAVHQALTTGAAKECDSSGA